MKQEAHVDGTAATFCTEAEILSAATEATILQMNVPLNLFVRVQLSSVNKSADKPAVSGTMLTGRAKKRLLSSVDGAWKSQAARAS